MRKHWLWLVAGVAALACLIVGILLWPRPNVWLDTSSDVVVLRNVATVADAALHRGVFTIGPDSCLYVTVEDDSGRVTYLAAVAPHVVVDRVHIKQESITFTIGGAATFSRAPLPGPVPPSALERCDQSKNVYSADLAVG